jgi:hypothetical protein
VSEVQSANLVRKGSTDHADLHLIQQPTQVAARFLQTVDVFNELKLLVNQEILDGVEIDA